MVQIEARIQISEEEEEEEQKESEEEEESEEENHKEARYTKYETTINPVR